MNEHQALLGRRLVYSKKINLLNFSYFFFSINRDREMNVYQIHMVQLIQVYQLMDSIHINSFGIR